MEARGLGEGGGCRVLLLGPDPPPGFLGPCSTVWVPLHAAIPLSGSYPRAVAAAAGSDVVAFTSPRTPRMIVLDARSHGDPGALQALGGSTAAAVGPATARAVEKVLGARVGLVPREHTGWHLGLAISRLGPGRVAWLRGDPAGPGLRAALEASGVELVEVIVYRLVETGMERRALRLLEEGVVDYVAFTSPSTARLLAPRLPPSGFRVVAIGPTTASALRLYGVEPDCVPSRYSLDGVGDCVNLLETGRRTGA
ncbi:MAG: uroporphyrinogen-III synthase [Desulfurococcales archaeon]|nr:uroporphyrinogen-III synthase [Desulfurococcales archaeon]